MNGIEIKKSRLKLSKSFNTDKITLKDQAFIFSTIVDLTDMGVSIQKSVEFIRVMKPKIKNQMDVVIKKLQEGKSFSEAFRPYVSTDVYYQLKIADYHGGLRRTLESISKVFNSRYEQRRKIKSLIQYPIFLMMFLGVMLIGMRIYIMPELANWDTGTASFRSKLIKIILIAIFLLSVLTALKLLLDFKKKTITNQIVLLCRLPVFGKLYKTYCHYYLTSNLALFVRSGMSIGSICNYMTHLDRESLLYQIGKRIEKGITDGQDVHKMILNAVFLPDELVFLIKKVSNRETLSEEINALSTLKYRNLVQAMERLVLIIQPILFGIVGIVIILMYISILTPMYSSMKEVS